MLLDPEAVSVTGFPAAAPPTANWMVPVGAVEPVLGVTVAVKVMDVPTVGEAGEAVMTVVVLTRPEVAEAATAVAKAFASMEPQPVTWS